MTGTLELSDTIPATPEEIYDAWLDSKKHSAMTDNTAASIDPEIGGKFTTGDGYIEGTFIELEPNHRIVQKWRTTDFSEDDPDSDLEIILEEAEGGTLLTLNQSNLPEDQVESYHQGWIDFYFEPMKAYFTKRKAAKKKGKK